MPTSSTISPMPSRARRARTSPAHSISAMQETRTSSTHSTTPPSHSTPTAATASRPPIRLRVASSDLGLASAIAPLAPAEARNRLLEHGAVEIRPERVDEEQLGIGRLPQQEVGEPLL